MAWMIIVGLFVSGVTALPLEEELHLLADWLNADGQQTNSGFAAWIVTVRDALQAVYRRYPFIAYGTDWLAFAHLIIAVGFIGALRDPVRNRWLFVWGVIAAISVIPWALIAGHVREIPLGWRLIDCSFGVGAFIPCWLGNRWSRELEAIQASGK